ncbi:MAG: hypothetical protein MUO55_02710 [Candidatus Atribacteria bacterium]|nr:hypothetical protein [Candidatus Atribacteria bacterium]
MFTKKLFSNLGYQKVMAGAGRNKMAIRIFTDIVLAIIANPASKMASVDILEEGFGVTH